MGVMWNQVRLGSMLTIGAMCVIAIAGCGTKSHPHPIRHAPAPTPSLSRFILPPATAPSQSGVCYVPLKQTLDGAMYPIFCTNGEVNAYAWDYYRKLYPAIFALGATPSQTKTQAVTKHVAQPLESAEAAYCLNKAYYGWVFNEGSGPYQMASGPSPSLSCSQNYPTYPSH